MKSEPMLTIYREIEDFMNGTKLCDIETFLVVLAYIPILKIDFRFMLKQVRPIGYEFWDKHINDSLMFKKHSMRPEL
jgi:hypothetical protein